LLTVRHIVHASRRLDAVAIIAAQASLSARAIAIPWGTPNDCDSSQAYSSNWSTSVSLKGFVSERAGLFSCGGLRGTSRAREGWRMLVLEGGRGPRMPKRFRAAGIGDCGVVDFERQAKNDGRVTAEGRFFARVPAGGEDMDIGILRASNTFRRILESGIPGHPNGVAGMLVSSGLREDLKDHRHFMEVSDVSEINRSAC